MIQVIKTTEGRCDSCGSSESLLRINFRQPGIPHSEICLCEECREDLREFLNYCPRKVRKVRYSKVI